MYRVNQLDPMPDQETAKFDKPAGLEALGPPNNFQLVAQRTHLFSEWLQVLREANDDGWPPRAFSQTTEQFDRLTLGAAPAKLS